MLSDTEMDKKPYNWRAPTSSATIHNLPFELCEARHGLAKSTQEVASSGLMTEYLDATSCVDFAKPCLASQSCWARRATCGLLHYWLEPFIWSQNQRKKLRWDIQLSRTRHNFLHRFCEAMSGFAKLLSPKGKLWIVALLVGALDFITFAKSTQEVALRY